MIDCVAANANFQSGKGNRTVSKPPHGAYLVSLIVKTFVTLVALLILLAWRDRNMTKIFRAVLAPVP